MGERVGFRWKSGVENGSSVIWSNDVMVSYTKLHMSNIRLVHKTFSCRDQI